MEEYLQKRSALMYIRKVKKAKPISVNALKSKLNFDKILKYI